MDAHLFRLFAERAQPFFEGAMLEKIQEPQPGLLTFSLYNRGEKRQFVFRFGKRNPFCFFTSLRLPAVSQPPAWIMRIRKYFVPHRLASVVFQCWQRKLWFMAGGQAQEDGKNPWLCLDFARGPMLLFMDEAELPEVDQPHWPDAAELADALENWRQWPVLTPALRKSLATLPPLDQLALLRDLEAGGGDVFIYRNSQTGPVERISPWPLEGKLASGLLEEAWDDILAAIGSAGADLALAPLYRRRDEELAERARKKLAHMEKLLANLENDQKKLRNMVAGGEAASAIKANLWRLDGGSHKEKLKLEDGAEIPLDRRFSIVENMNRLFNNATRGKRGLKMLAGRKSAIMDEMAAFKAGAGIAEKEDVSENATTRQAPMILPRTFPKDVAVFQSSDGFLLLRGKNAKGNAAARKLAAPHDLWVHVEKGQGAHVIIRRQYPGQEVPEKTLLEAGSLAANKSWLAESDQGAVMYAEIRHVKPIRKSSPGNVAIDRLAFTKLVPLDSSLEKTLAASPGQ